ncbi:DNA double-strand break repair nuclease NurA [Candidatus Oleimmundimicrobium sp.]|uniref:DNA double-strand break repair nuclease NurA n=1 Tax=Candidatus Oleimmundimicrobium sp. TaxID=3060597 RepID=UPI002723B968|nr:DNA double-strand break repair nuclease NurA [Candidatus Oleimmundimicrobium sp.]MDO8886918.1 hypothetical protein [Candidatus Oleimmundimicrobium sp.]
MISIDKHLENKLKESAKFIKKILTEAPSYIKFELKDEGNEPLSIDKNIDEKSFESISKNLSFKKKIAAIDGGSVKIANGHSFNVGAYRYGYVLFSSNNLIKEEICSPIIETLSATNAGKKFSKLYLEIAQEIPEELPKWNKTLDCLRELKEWTIAEKLLNELDDGDLLLIDGSLRSSKSLPGALIERICKKAAEKKINLVGITKRSTFSWGKHSPLLPMIYQIGERAYPKKSWFCPLSNFKENTIATRWFGNIYAAKFSPTSKFVFRVDINRFDSTNPKKIMDKLAAISDDPVYMGYPYPLAAIHNRVRIEPHEKEDLYYHLQGLTLKEGVKMEEWEALFSDFHDLLDIN